MSEVQTIIVYKAAMLSNFKEVLYKYFYSILRKLRATEAESGHGRYYLFSFCYLEITKKSFHYHEITAHFSRDNRIN